MENTLTHILAGSYMRGLMSLSFPHSKSVNCCFHKSFYAGQTKKLKRFREQAARLAPFSVLMLSLAYWLLAVALNLIIMSAFPAVCNKVFV